MLNLQIDSTTPRTIESFCCLFNDCLSQFPARARDAVQQKMYLADTVFFLLEGDGFAGKLPFTREDAYLSVGIPKEFLRM